MLISNKKMEFIKMLIVWSVLNLFTTAANANDIITFACNAVTERLLLHAYGYNKRRHKWHNQIAAANCGKQHYNLLTFNSEQLEHSKIPQLLVIYGVTPIVKLINGTSGKILATINLRKYVNQQQDGKIIAASAAVAMVNHKQKNQVILTITVQGVINKIIAFDISELLQNQQQISLLWQQQIIEEIIPLLSKTPDANFALGRMANNTTAFMVAVRENDKAMKIKLLKFINGEIITTLDINSKLPQNYYLTSLVAIDEKQQQKVSRVYFGDSMGNMWRLNVTTINSSWWHIDNRGPIFLSSVKESVWFSRPLAAVINGKVVLYWWQLNGRTKKLIKIVDDDISVNLEEDLFRTNFSTEQLVDAAENWQMPFEISVEDVPRVGPRILLDILLFYYPLRNNKSNSEIKLVNTISSSKLAIVNAEIADNNISKKVVNFLGLPLLVSKDNNFNYIPHYILQTMSWRVIYQ